MADEIIVRFDADASPLIEAMESVSASIKAGAASIDSSLESINAVSASTTEAIQALGPALVEALTPSESVFQAVGASMTSMLAEFGSVGEEADALGPQLAVATDGATTFAIAITNAGSALEAAIAPEVALSSAIDALLGPLTETGSILDSVVIPAENAFQVALDALLEPLSAVSSELQLLTPLEEAFSAALNKTFASLSQASSSLEQVAISEADLSKALDTLLEPLIAIDEALQETANYADLAVQSLSLLGPAGEELTGLETALAVSEVASENLATALNQALASLTELGTTATTTAEQLSSASASLGTFDEALALMADAQTASVVAASTLADAQQAVADVIAVTTPIIETMDTALAGMATAQLAAAQASQDATELQALYQRTNIDTATSTDAVLAAMAEAQGATSAYTVALGEGIVASAGLTAAIEALAAIQARGNVSSATLSAALMLVETEAKKLGVTAGWAGTQLNILASAESNAAISAEVAATATGGLDRQLAMAAARMAAMDVGAGQLGYTFGTLARQGGVLGTVLSTLFLPILVITFAEVIGSLIQKFTHLEDEIRKAARALDDISDSARVSAESIELQNLKLEDQIAKLEGRPTTNRLKEAVLEARIEVDKLNKSLEDTIDKEIQALENANVGLFTSLFTNEKATSIVSTFGSTYNDIIAQEKAYEALVAKKQYAINTLNDLDENASAEQKATAQKNLDDITAAAEKQQQTIVNIARQTYEKLEVEKKKEIDRFVTANTRQPGQVGTFDDLGPKAMAAAVEKLNEKYAGTERALLNVLNLHDSLNKQAKALDVKGGLESNVTGLENRKDEISLAEKQLGFEKQIADIRSSASEARSKIGVKTESAEYSGVKEQAALDAAYAKDRQILLLEAEANRSIEDQYAASLNKIAALDTKYQESKITLAAKTAAAIIEENKKIIAEQEKATEDVTKQVAKPTSPRDLAAARELNAENRRIAELTLKDIDDEIKATERKFSIGREGRDQEVTDLRKLTEELQKQRALQTLPIRQEITKLQQETTTPEGLPQGPPAEYLEKMKELARLQNELEAITGRYDDKLEEVNSTLAKLDLSADRFFEMMRNETLSTTDLFSKSWQNVITELNSEFSSAFAQYIEHGGDFDRAMANMGVHMLASLTDSLTKWGLKQIEVHLATLLKIKALDEANASQPAGIPGLKGGPQLVAGQIPDQAALTTNTVSTDLNTTALNTLTTALQEKSVESTLPKPAASSAELEKLFPEKQSAATVEGIEKPLSSGATDFRTVLAAHPEIRPEQIGRPVLPVPTEPSPTAGAIPRNIPIPEGTVGGGAGVEQQITQVRAANAQKQALYAQDTTAFKTAQVQKDLAQTTSSAQQTAQVTVSQVQQTTQVVTSKASQTAATVTANATQVSSSVAAGAATVAADKASTSASKLDHAKSAAVKAYDAMAGIPIIGPALGAAAAAATFAFLVAFAEGGHVQGAGTATSDSIPARLSHGEFVVRASEVSKPGMLQHLSTINAGGMDSAPMHSHGGMIVHAKGGGFLDSLFGKIALPGVGALRDSFTKGTHSWSMPLTYAVAGIRNSIDKDSPGALPKGTSSGSDSGAGHAQGGLIEPTIAFSHGGIVMPAINMSTFSSGGIVTTSKHFATGGAVSADAPASSGSVTHNNMRFQFAPTVNGNFDVSKHGEEMFGFMQSKLRRSGVDI